MILFLLLLALLYAKHKRVIEIDLFEFLTITAMLCCFFEVFIEVTTIFLLLEN